MARHTAITRSAVIIAFALLLECAAAEAGLRGSPAVALAEQDDAGDNSDDDKTTTPAPKTDYVSIVQGLEDNLLTQLHSVKFQWVNPLLAFIFGLVLLFNGEATLRMVVVAGAFILAGSLAMADVSAEWHLPESSTVRLIVGCEVGLLAAYGTYLGIEGVLMCLWAVIGALLAFGFEKQLVHRFETFEEEKWHVVVVYTLFVGVALLLFSTGKHRRFVAAVSAFLGGALLVSSLSWVITEMYLHNYLAFFDSMFHDLHPKGADWIDFLHLLFSRDAKDVGIFSGSAYNPDIEGTWHLDRVVGTLSWLALLLAGTKYQWDVIREDDTAMGRCETGYSKTVNAREGLDHPLLTEE